MLILEGREKTWKTVSMETAIFNKWIVYSLTFKFVKSPIKFLKYAVYERGGF